ncbi:hypothetical protein [Propionivibrio soli]|nr:hypothetical protein [Propionivibrio soli]
MHAVVGSCTPQRVGGEKGDPAMPVYVVRAAWRRIARLSQI